MSKKKKYEPPIKLKINNNPETISKDPPTRDVKLTAEELHCAVVALASTYSTLKNIGKNFELQAHQDRADRYYTLAKKLDRILSEQSLWNTDNLWRAE